MQNFSNIILYFDHFLFGFDGSLFKKQNKLANKIGYLNALIFTKIMT